MNFKDLRNLDKDDLLGLMGLETKHSTAGYLAGTLGTFGVGLLVGAGIALLLAPKPGNELREDIREKLRRSRRRVDPLRPGPERDPGRNRQDLLARVRRRLVAWGGLAGRACPSCASENGRAPSGV